MAKVSVVMPVYNRSGPVRRAIDSVLRQDFSDFELIVVDDGSTDDTVTVVAAVEDPRVKLLRQVTNSGGNAARNRGIVESSAPIIAFLDSDDEYLPNKLGVVIDAFDREPDLGALVDSYTDIIPGENEGLPQDRINPIIETSDEFLAALFGSSLRCRRLWKSASGISLRREVAFRAGLFNEEIERRQDMEFLARVAKVTRCATSDKRLWIKHVMQDCISTKSQAYMRATIVVCQRNPEYLVDRSLSVALSRDIMRHFFRSAREGRWAEIIRDTRLFTSEFGLSRLIRLAGRYCIPVKHKRSLTGRA